MVTAGLSGDARATVGMSIPEGRSNEVFEKAIDQQVRKCFAKAGEPIDYHAAVLSVTEILSFVSSIPRAEVRKALSIQ